MNRQLAIICTYFVGFSHIMLVLCILFAPLFRTNCNVTNGELICRDYVSLIQLGSTFRGYLILAVMLGIGIGAILTARFGNLGQVRAYHRRALSITVIVILLELWTFGIYFVPVALFMLILGFTIRPTSDLQVRTA
jgi:hypothetical protein